jgi:hypothetical protein
MTKLEKYEAVNKTTSLKELAVVIRLISDSGQINGRTRTFDSEKMALLCENYNLTAHNELTRNYGIRQQAMMLLFYKLF